MNWKLQLHNYLNQFIQRHFLRVTSNVLLANTLEWMPGTAYGCPGKYVFLNRAAKILMIMYKESVLVNILVGCLPLS